MSEISAIILGGESTSVTIGENTYIGDKIYTDFAEARQQAATEGKILVINDTDYSDAGRITTDGISIIGTGDPILSGIGLYRTYDVTISLDSVTLSDNTQSQGAAVYLNKGTLKLNNVNFSNNTATHASFAGGAVYVANGTFKNSQFKNNSAANGGAAGIIGAVTVSDSSFTENTAALAGGALHATTAAIVSDSTFTGNVANGTTALQGGGAIYFTAGGEVNRSQFSGNQAANGGAIFLYSGDLNISNSKFLTETDTIFNRGGMVNFSGENQLNASITTAPVTTVRFTAKENAVLVFGNATGINFSMMAFEGNNTLNFKGSATVTFTSKQDVNGADIVLKNPETAGEYIVATNINNAGTVYVAEKSDGNIVSASTGYLNSDNSLIWQYALGTSLTVSASDSVSVDGKGLTYKTAASLQDWEFLADFTGTITVDAAQEISQALTLTGTLVNNSTITVDAEAIWGDGDRTKELLILNNYSGTGEIAVKDDGKLRIDENGKVWLSDAQNESVAFVNVPDETLKIGDITYVGDNYDTLAGAVGAAEETVIINGGTYNEAVAVKADKNIIGLNNASIAENDINTANTGAVTTAAGTLLTLDGVVFDGNTSARGSAIYAGGNAVIANAVFRKNHVDTTGTYNGGAIFVNGSTVTISSSLFDSNTCVNNAGAIFVNGGTVKISESTFATATDAIGGRNGTVVFENTNYLNADVKASGSSSKVIAEENASLVFGNSEEIGLIGMNFNGNNTLKFNGSETVKFATNLNSSSMQDLKGGDIILKAPVAGDYTVATKISNAGNVYIAEKADGNIVSASTAYLNSDKNLIWQYTLGTSLAVSASDSVSVDGKGLTYKTAASLQDWEFLADFTGTITVDSAQEISQALTLTGTLVNNSTITVDAEAIWGDGDRSKELLILNNYSGSGTITVKNDGAIRIENGNVYLAYAANETAALVNVPAGTLKVGDVTYSGTNYDTLIDAVSSREATVIINGGEYTESLADLRNKTIIGINGAKIVENTASAIKVNRESVLDGLIFENNSATNGSAILAAANTSVSGAIFRNNKVTGTGQYNGGAVYAQGSVTVTINNSLFDNNTSASSNGGAIYGAADTGTVRISNSKFLTETDSISTRGAVIFENTNHLNADVYAYSTGSITVAENAALVFGNTTGITLTGMTFAGSNTVTFSGSAVVTFDTELLDVDKIAVTVDGSKFESGDIIASGVTGTLGADDVLENSDLSLVIKDGNLILKAAAKAGMLEENSTGSVYGGGSVANDGTGISQTIASGFKQGTVFAGSQNGVDSVITTTVTGGSIKKNLYGGGKVSADTTNLTIDGGEVGMSVYGGFLASKASQKISLTNSNLTIDSGTFNSNIIGGSRVDVGSTVLTHEVTNVKLTLNGGNFAGVGTSTDAGTGVFAAGYVVGNKSASNTVQYYVDSCNVTVDGAALVPGVLYGGAYTSYCGYAEVGNVNITVESGSINTLVCGGWAQTNGLSKVGNIQVNINNGSVTELYAGGANAGGNTEVTGMVDITISGNAAVTELFMGGKYNKSLVSGDVTVTISGDAKNFDRISGNGSFLENTGVSSLIVDTIVNVAALDGIDKLTITDGSQLNLTDADFAGLTEICFDLGDGVLDTADWTALTGASLDNFNGVKFMVDDTEMILADGVYSGSGFKVYEEDNSIKFAKLA